MKFRPLYFLISAAFLGLSIYSLIFFGLNPSIEFTGGATYQLELNNKSESLDDLLKDTPSFKSYTLEDNLLTITLGPITQEEATQIKDNLASQNIETTEISFTTVGPTIGKQLLTKALTAILIATTSTLLYIAYSFKNLKFGLFAVMATLHDTIILIGMYAFFAHFYNYQSDLLFVTAVLTTISFSVHDTIVVFDRIRELKSKTSDSLETIADQAVTETIVRSVNNSLTIIFMLLALFLLGGSTIHGFSLALLIGAITGTYSSTFVAIPLLVTWENLMQKR